MRPLDLRGTVTSSAPTLHAARRSGRRGAKKCAPMGRVLRFQKPALLPLPNPPLPSPPLAQHSRQPCRRLRRWMPHQPTRWPLRWPHRWLLRRRLRCSPPGRSPAAQPPPPLLFSGCRPWPLIPDRSGCACKPTACWALRDACKRRFWMDGSATFFVWFRGSALGQSAPKSVRFQRAPSGEGRS